MQIVKNLNKLASIFLVIILIIPIFSFPGLALAIAGDYSWVKSVGGVSNDYSNHITTDELGNIHTTGFFTGTTDFDPGAGTSNLISNGNNDIFISKLNEDGDLVWAKSIGGAGDDSSYSIINNGGDDVYTTGTFVGTVDFDPGAGTSNLISNGNDDIFISKLNSDGNFVWAKNIGGTSNDAGYSIFLDSSGDVYVTGYFSGTVDFDPSVEEISNLVSAGDSDIFILKLDSFGDFVWAKRMGGASTDYANSITIDARNDIYTSGTFSGTGDFDPGAGTSNLVSNGNNDIFISKLDSDGNFVWAKSMGGASGDIAESLVVESQNPYSVYTTGSFQDTADFDPGAGTSNLVSAGDNDIFISKLDTDGNFVWAKNIGGASSDYSTSIHLDMEYVLYITGYFEGTVDFDPGVGSSNLVSSVASDIFISKLDSDGNFVWAKSIMGDSFDGGVSATSDFEDTLYIAGSFRATSDFDPGEGVVNLTPVGNSDMFVLKLVADYNNPILSEVTPVGVVVNNEAISYTFNTDEAGDITYGGSCTSATTTATVGNNTITFNTLSVGTYSDCTITVTDASDNVSSVLTVSPFSLVVHSGGGGAPSTPTEPVAPTTPTTPITPPVTPETPTTPSNPTTPTTPTNGTNPIIPKIECPSDQLITQNLKVDGIDGLFHEYTRAIVGEVKILQSYLNNFGFKSGKVDGIIGPITRGAIIRLQQYLNISPDGIVGPITRDLINEGCE